MMLQQYRSFLYLSAVWLDPNRGQSTIVASSVGPQGLLSGLTTNSEERPSEQPQRQGPSRLFTSEGWEGEADVSDWEPFRLLGRSMIDYIADYYQGVESLPVRARVEPGYLKVNKGREMRRQYLVCKVPGDEWFGSCRL